MTKHTKQELFELVDKCNKKLSQLKPHLKVSDLTEELYNKILIEKAVYKQMIESYEEPFFKRLLKVVSKLNPSSNRLICDYFK